ncbi:hypothetical protein ACP70R_049476 [Stipagrostis hirtigluma subsp. patula]
MAGRRRACTAAAAASAITAAVLLTLVPFADASMSSWEWRSEDDYHLFVVNRMPANMHLSCYAFSGDGASEFYHSFRADPDREEALPFLDPAPGAKVTCKWACNDSYLRDVTLFSDEWKEASSGACTNGGKGCSIVFEGWQVFVVKRARGGRGRLLGDLPERECEKMLLLFNGNCRYKDHQNPYVGTVMEGVAEYTLA